MRKLCLLVALTQFCAWAGSQCVSKCLSWRDEFDVCQDIENKSIQPRAEVVLLSVDSSWHQSTAQGLISHSLYQTILLLVCESLPLVEGEGPPYCILNVSVTEEQSSAITSQCSSHCNTTCAVVPVVVWDLYCNKSVSASDIAQLLNSGTSRAALYSAGVAFISATIGREDSLLFAEVPLASWVCVLLGVLASIAVLSQPLWWDKCCKKLLKSE